MALARLSQLAVCITLLAACVSAQIGPPRAGGAAPVRTGISVVERPAHTPGGPYLPAQRPGRGVVMPWGGGWGPVWGWPWGGTSVIVQEKEVEKEPAFRPWVENKDYTRELLKPVTRDYPDGSLPEPKLQRRPQIRPCKLTLTDGTKVESQNCERRADLVSYTSTDGARTFLSRDLVNWPLSSFGEIPPRQ